MSKITMKEYVDMQVKFIAARLTELRLGDAAEDDQLAQSAKLLADHVLNVNEIALESNEE